MKQIKFGTAKEVKGLCEAIEMLANARKLENESKKQVEAAKAVIRESLISTRNLDIESLPENETVLVTIGTERGLKIDRRGKDSLDVKSLRVNSPDVAEKFTKRSVASYFEPMI